MVTRQTLVLKFGVRAPAVQQNIGYMKEIELFNDHFQNFKSYGIPKAQLIIADVPYNLGANAYASNPAWYIDGDNKNGVENPV